MSLRYHAWEAGSANCLTCHSADESATTPTQPRPTQKKDGTSSFHNSINRSSAPLKDVLVLHHLPVFFRRGQRHLDLTSNCKPAATNQSNVSLTSSQQQHGLGSASATLAASAALNASVRPVAVGSGLCQWPPTRRVQPKLRKLLAACQNRRKRRAPRTEIEMFVGEATSALCPRPQLLALPRLLVFSGCTSSSGST